MPRRYSMLNEDVQCVSVLEEYNLLCMSTMYKL